MFDAVQTWLVRRHRQTVASGAPGPPTDLGLRFVTFFDEDPGGGTPEVAAGKRFQWVRYPVANAGSCRNQDVLKFVRSVLLDSLLVGLSDLPNETNDVRVRQNGGQVDKVAFRKFTMHGGGHRRGLGQNATAEDHWSG